MEKIKENNNKAWTGIARPPRLITLRGSIQYDFGPARDVHTYFNKQ